MKATFDFIWNNADVHKPRPTIKVRTAPNTGDAFHVPEFFLSWTSFESELCADPKTSLLVSLDGSEEGANETEEENPIALACVQHRCAVVTLHHSETLKEQVKSRFL